MVCLMAISCRHSGFLTGHMLRCRMYGQVGRQFSGRRVSLPSWSGHYPRAASRWLQREASVCTAHISGAGFSGYPIRPSYPWRIFNR